MKLTRTTALAEWIRSVRGGYGERFWNCAPLLSIVLTAMIMAWGLITSGGGPFYELLQCLAMCGAVAALAAVFGAAVVALGCRGARYWGTLAAFVAVVTEILTPVRNIDFGSATGLGVAVAVSMLLTAVLNRRFTIQITRRVSLQQRPTRLGRGKRLAPRVRRTVAPLVVLPWVCIVAGVFYGGPIFGLLESHTVGWNVFGAFTGTMIAAPASLAGALAAAVLAALGLRRGGWLAGAAVTAGLLIRASETFDAQSRLLFWWIPMGLAVAIGVVLEWAAARWQFTLQWQATQWQAPQWHRRRGTAADRTAVNGGSKVRSPEGRGAGGCK